MSGELLDVPAEELAKWEEQLREDVGSFSRDPYGFVLYAFSWGEGDLAPTPDDPEPGPDEWQAEVLKELGRRLCEGSVKDAAGAFRYVGEAIQFAISSGHGIGKTALIAWLILWAMATFEDTRGIVTANTKTQLTTKTWAELAKWHRMFIAAHWFVVEKTSIHAADEKRADTWRIDAIPWSKTKPEAFAGLHNQGKRILIIFDEGAAIDDIIWETTEGATTDQGTEIIWLVFANPTRNTGRFRECWRKFRKLWKTWMIDSRRAKKTNKKNIKSKLDAWGEDSDYARVRVKGEFPRVGDRQFISTELVEAARDRHLREKEYSFAPKIIGVDPAWDGGDETTIYLRQGLMSKKLAVFEKNDNDAIIAGHIARFEDEEGADGVIIDQGWGTGIYSCGKTMGRKWHLVSSAESSPDPGYLNMRAYMWGQGKQWLKDGGSIEADTVVEQEFIGPEFHTRPDGKIQIESKDDMKDRGLHSPNRVEAILLTFARRIQKKSGGRARMMAAARRRRAAADYTPKI